MARAFRTVVLLLFLAAFAAAAWVAFRGAQARGHLEDAADGVSVLQRQVGSLEIDEARTTLEGIQDDTAQARELTSDPVWRAVAQFPWGGQNLKAVATATEAVDGLAQEGLPAFVDAGDGVATFKDKLAAGQPDPGLLGDVRDSVVVLNSSIEETRSQLEAIDRSYVVRAVSNALDELEESLSLADQVAAELGVEVETNAGG